MRVARGTAVLAMLGLVACGGGGSDGGAPADGFPAVAEFTTLDLARLDNYAAPAWPAHYAEARFTDNAPADNRVTDAGATLGRVLFHDAQLSRTGERSCASCHDQAQAFSDPEQFSRGVDGQRFTSAHSMRLANYRFFQAGRAFWDRRSPSLEDQVLQPVSDPVELGFDAAHGGLAAALERLRSRPYYPELFRFVYGDPAITEDRVRRALAQYVRSIVSLRSRFDAGWAATFTEQRADRGLLLPFPGFTAEENRGKALFMTDIGEGGAGCMRCHAPPAFAQLAGVGSNGLDPGETRTFKSPSLKNVAVTGPYMHDGRFPDLFAVVNHYDSGVQEGPAVDGLLRRDGGPVRLGLSEADKAALVAFMGTLTDEAILGDPRFTSPFRR